MTSSTPVDGSAVRVRMAPSPTGSPHVGLVRTALYNWAFARHHGGTFVFRIEDTDAARNTQESYDSLLDLFRWLGLDWDEGPEVGGAYAPYLQSERFDIYADVATRLRESGHAYHCYCSADELEQRNEMAKSEGRTPGYDGHCRELSDEQRTAYEAEGRKPTLRFRMPGQAITFTDLVRGEITFQAEHVPDYVLVRGNGHPLYTLVSPVDDALMDITHVLRGEDLLSSTPRQVALHAALADIGVGSGRMPEFGHLPYVMGQGNKKLSKRDPEANALGYRDAGFLPEGLLNYMALLGWAIADDRDVFTLDEMVQAFEIGRVNPNPARFDLKKCEAINASHMRLLSVDEMTARMTALPARRRARRRPAHRRRGDAAARGGAARARAHRQADRGRRHARLPPRRRGRLHPRPRRRGQAARRRRAGRRQGRARRAGRPRRLDHRGDRRGPAPGTGRGARAQAAQRVRPRAGRRDRQPCLAAAVRVPGAARSRALARPAEQRAGRLRGQGERG